MNFDTVKITATIMTFWTVSFICTLISKDLNYFIFCIYYLMVMILLIERVTDELNRKKRM